MEKSPLLENAVLEDSTDSVDSDQSEEQTCASTSTPIPVKRGQRTVV